jgi:hypothetical protein
MERDVLWARLKKYTIRDMLCIEAPIGKIYPDQELIQLLNRSAISHHFTRKDLSASEFVSLLPLSSGCC